MYSEQPEPPAFPSLMESLRGTPFGMIPSKTSATFSSDEGAADLVLELSSLPFRVAQDHLLSDS